ncbi:hypothetical protein [Streptomyces sp. ST2-7A]|uniref:hypothetical protein n=1 Tax=Streptomyces sp. ST2-7A TaxID=2907214 RepID=UPI001F1B8843|nr:hypothetical protein [Streptomyces sp. ST2-7A]MCE7080478.1 hypothetical protein [Streptomyces sp. ST2-7A]
MARAGRIGLYVLSVLVLYSIIAWPVPSADFVRMGFDGISAAATGVGDFVADLVR